MTLEDFLTRLDAAHLPCDYRDVRDVLWLAQFATVAPARLGAEPLPAIPEPRKERDQRPPPSGQAMPKDVARDRQRVSVPSTVPQGEFFATMRGGTGARARIERVPGVAALADALEIARALRPFSRRRRSATVTTFDEEATVERTAETQVLSVVMRPVFERWFELVLLVEHSESMVVWRQTVTELQKIFERNGCFSAVTRWTIRDKDGTIALVSPAGATHAPDEIRARTANRLVVLVSDATSAAWHDGRMARILAPMAQRMPVAILQLLPAHAWRNTALGAAEWTFWSTTPGAANRDLDMTAPWWSDAPDNAVRLPIVALNPEAVLAWARTVMAGGGARVGGVEMPLEGGEDSAATEDPPDAAARVERFRAAATPVAFRLATMLSAATPLTAPTMRLVQQAMMPGSRPDVLAEVFLGDLMQRETSAEDDVAEDEIAYAFRDGVREKLLASLSGSAAEDVLGKVAGYLSRRYGQTIDFRALYADPRGAERLPEGAQPFARLARDVMGRHSGVVPGAVAQREYVEELKFGEGLTVAGDFELAGDARQIEWSSDGDLLGARHAVGVTTYGTDGEGPTRQYRSYGARVAYVTFAHDIERGVAKAFAERLRLAVERQFGVPWHFIALGADDTDPDAGSPEQWNDSLGTADAIVVLLTPDYFHSRFRHAQATLLEHMDNTVDVTKVVLKLSPLEETGFESVPAAFTVTPSPLEPWHESNHWHGLPQPLIDQLLPHFSGIEPRFDASSLLSFNLRNWPEAMYVLEQRVFMSSNTYQSEQVQDGAGGFALRRVRPQDETLVFYFDFPHDEIRAAAVARNGDMALVDAEGFLTRQTRTADGWQASLRALSGVTAVEWPFGEGNILIARTISGMRILESHEEQGHVGAP